MSLLVALDLLGEFQCLQRDVAGELVDHVGGSARHYFSRGHDATTGSRTRSRASRSGRPAARSW